MTTFSEHPRRTADAAHPVSRISDLCGPQEVYVGLYTHVEYYNICLSRKYRRRRRRDENARKFDFCIPPPQSTPSPPAVRAPRDPFAGAIITSVARVAGLPRTAGGRAKCLTRCSKLHLIQRPRLAKWHIVPRRRINQRVPFTRGGGKTTCGRAPPVTAE